MHCCIETVCEFVTSTPESAEQRDLLLENGKGSKRRITGFKPCKERV